MSATLCSKGWVSHTRGILDLGTYVWMVLVFCVVGATELGLAYKLWLNVEDDRSWNADENVMIQF